MATRASLEAARSAHSAFYQALGYAPDFEDPSNHLDVETQLGWLRDIGFIDVDCYWKWLEMALLIGVKSRVSGLHRWRRDDPRNSVGPCPPP